MKELDLLLARWLEQRWPEAGAGARAAFERLLDQQDPEIAAWLLGRSRPADPAMAALVDELIADRA